MAGPCDPVGTAILDSAKSIFSILLLISGHPDKMTATSPAESNCKVPDLATLLGLMSRSLAGAGTKSQAFIPIKAIVDLENTVSGLKMLGIFSADLPPERSAMSEQSEVVRKFCGDFNEPNAVGVTTGGETIAHGLLNWKSSASAVTSSVSSVLGSKTDEFFARRKTMVSETVETLYDALSKSRTNLTAVDGVDSESRRLIYLNDRPWPQLTHDFGEYHDLSKNIEGRYGFSGHDTPPILHLSFVWKVCSIAFPLRLFGQPVLMRTQRILDPG